MISTLSARSDDIDLFVGAPPPSATEVPNVLILLDNTGNWSSPFSAEMAALVSTFNALPVDKFRVGIMFFTETGGGNKGEDGAYVRASVRLMNSANKEKYKSLITSFDDINDRSNSGKLGKAMAEAYYYFSGMAPYAGNKKDKTDYLGNVLGAKDKSDTLAASRAVWALPGNALPSKDGSPYNSPITNGCQNNFIIYISNGAAQDSNADITAAAALLAAAGGSTSAIPISPSGSQDNVGDEWARFMKKSSAAITTYTVDVNKVTTGQGPGWTALLKSIAGVSGGKYFDVDSTVGAGSEIVAALNSIFSEIQAVNSVFASVSLPVSVNTQGTYLNQVFVGMFRPDEDAAPRWAGNLKQYKVGFDNTKVLRLLGADDKNAINAGTGFIAECARSFWTPTTADKYWANNPQGTCITGSNADISNLLSYAYDVSNTPDGNIVEKGAQAYKLRETTTRTVKTCSASFGACTSLTEFNTANVSQTDLGAADSTEHTALVNWAKGLDVDDENVNEATTTEMRQSAHGDVVHSRPVAINYGNDASPEVVVFYGGNDGILRAVNGNRSESIGSVPAGGELWSFVAPEFFGNIKRMRDNDTPISFKGSTTPGALPKPYGMDGPVTAYRAGDATWIYATMRRGGRAIYALDVSNPASPSLKWKKGCPNLTNDTGCTTGFSNIGQTWATPTFLKASGQDSGATPIMMMGGGYHVCEDTDNDTNNHSCNSDSKGKGIYVLNANTGTLLRASPLPTDRGVVGDVIVVPDSETGMAKFAYAADLGGNVYRIDIGNAAPASWTITKIASLGCDDVDSCEANRKFLYGPDVVEEVDGTIYLLLGSGDREKPLTGYKATTGVENHFFMIKDKPADTGWLNSAEETCKTAVICKDSLTAIETSATPTQSALDKTKGWWLALSATEQVVTSAITLLGEVTFSTHQPAVPVLGACGSNLGETRVYNIKYLNAAAVSGVGVSGRYQDVSGDGLPPSPVIAFVKLDSGIIVPVKFGASPDGPIAPTLGGTQLPGSPLGRPKSRVYWYIQQ